MFVKAHKSVYEEAKYMFQGKLITIFNAYNYFGK
jgi:hypothetical protein